MTHLDEVFDHPLTRKERRLLKKKTNRAERRANGGQQPGPKFGGLQLKRIFPKTANQEKIFDCFEHEENILALGYAGTGKTFLLTYLCLNEIMNNPESRYKKLIIARSALSSRDQGFLPGTEEQKASVFEQPYNDACKKLFGRGDAYDILKKMGLVEFKTTSFIRGITLDDCLVIVDEGQNLTWVEISGMITRMGDNTRIHIAGDHRQSDHKFNDERAGFVNFLKVVKHMESFGVIEMEIDDIVRGPIVKEFILRATQQGLM
jgi:phosphate starvation-inducible protein PhoH